MGTPRRLARPSPVDQPRSLLTHMRIISYVVRYDVGFAPNPFHGVCTLATCRPDIRRRAAIGDWLVGTASAQKQRGGHLVYAMEVTDALTFEEYWSDSRYAHKRANLRGSRKAQHGDNIYHREIDGEWQQENSRHSKADGTVEPAHLAKDTGTNRVLIGTNFVYFGGSGPAVPESLRSKYEVDLVHEGIGDHYVLEPEHMGASLEWITSLGTGVRGRPGDWPRGANPSRQA